MFEIKIAPPQKMPELKAYLGIETKGLIMAAYEGEVIKAAAAFDLSGSCAVLEAVRAEDELKVTICRAVFNFMDLNGIGEVYSLNRADSDLHCELGFKPAKAKDEDGYAVLIELNGYFEKSHCCKCE